MSDTAIPSLSTTLRCEVPLSSGTDALAWRPPPYILLARVELSSRDSLQMRWFQALLGIPSTIATVQVTCKIISPLPASRFDSNVFANLEDSCCIFSQCNTSSLLHLIWNQCYCCNKSEKGRLVANWIGLYLKLSAKPLDSVLFKMVVKSVVHTVPLQGPGSAMWLLNANADFIASTKRCWASSPVNESHLGYPAWQFRLSNQLVAVS